MCDEEKRKIVAETEKQLIGNDVDLDFEEDFYVATEKNLPKRKKKEDENDFEDLESIENFSSDSDEIEMKKINELENDSDFSDNEDEDMMNLNDTSDEEIETKMNNSLMSNESDESCDSTKEENPKVWEDIYGRTRDKDGNILLNRYIPPAVRAKNLEKDSQNEKLIQLKRQLKGPLNRLTDRNMHTISSQVKFFFLNYN